MLNGEIKVDAFKLYDLALAAGVSGTDENYLGASGRGQFQDYQLAAAFLAGTTCNTDVLKSLDPRVADFIEIPNNKFSGAYIRGSASMPIYTSQPKPCVFTLGVGADLGTWRLTGTPGVTGGLIGGSAFGKLACIASLRGQLMTYAQKSKDGFTFEGDGFGVAGVGACEQDTWTSVEKSREDTYCGTGDVSFGVKYSNGWTVDAKNPTAVH